MRCELGRGAAKLESDEQAAQTKTNIGCATHTLPLLLHYLQEFLNPYERCLNVRLIVLPRSVATVDSVRKQRKISCRYERHHTPYRPSPASPTNCEISS